MKKIYWLMIISNTAIYAKKYQASDPPAQSGIF